MVSRNLLSYTVEFVTLYPVQVLCSTLEQEQFVAFNDCDFTNTTSLALLL